MYDNTIRQEFLMGYQMDQVERVDLSKVEEGNSIQLTGTVEGRAVSLGVDVFRRTLRYQYAIGFATQQAEGDTQPSIDMGLSERFFRLPLEGIIEPGEVVLETLAAPQSEAGKVDSYPDDRWARTRLGCVAIELFHLVAE